MHKLLRTIGFLVAFSCSQNAAAQSTHLNVDTVRIVAKALDDEAQKCGVSEGSLDASVRLPIAAVPQLRVTTAAAPAAISVSANVMRLNSGLCVASYDVDLFRWSTEWQNVASVWNDGGILTGPVNDFDARLRRSIEGLTKNFLAEWLKARQ